MYRWPFRGTLYVPIYKLFIIIILLAHILSLLIRNKGNAGVRRKNYRDAISCMSTLSRHLCS